MFFRIKLQYLACNEMGKKPEIKLLVYAQDTESRKETKYCCKWPWKSHQVVVSDDNQYELNLISTKFKRICSLSF